MDDLFAQAAGCLGWAPDAILKTPIPQLEAALEARYAFIRGSSPTSGPDSQTHKVVASVNRDDIAAGIKAGFGDKKRRKEAKGMKRRKGQR